MRTVACLLLVSLLVALPLTAPPAFAQPERDEQPEPKQVGFKAAGTELFRALLLKADIHPITRGEWDARESRNWESKDVIVIVFGKPPDHSRGQVADGVPEERKRINDALKHGGAALIATDYHYPFTVRNRELVIDGSKVNYKGTSGGLHDSKPGCPYLTPLQPREPRPNDPAEMLLLGSKPLRKVATNNPSFLHIKPFTPDALPEFRFPLATLPPGGKLDNHERPLPFPLLFAVAGDHESSRFLMMADHSVFINQMLIEPGTDNLEFAQRVIAFLSDGKRNRCLFIEDGEVIERFDDLRAAYAKTMPMPALPFDKLADFGNQVIDKVQEKNTFNKLLLGSDDDPGTQSRRKANIIAGLLIAGTVLAMLFLMKRFFAARKPGNLPPPIPVAGVAAGPPGVFDRRQRELLRRNNVYEPIRDLLRDFFGSVGVRGEPGPTLPALTISKAVRKPGSLRQAIGDFWKLAYGTPKQLTALRWRELESYFDRVRQAHADGKWWFVFEDATTGSVE